MVPPCRVSSPLPPDSVVVAAARPFTLRLPVKAEASNELVTRLLPMIRLPLPVSTCAAVTRLLLRVLLEPARETRFSVSSPVTLLRVPSVTAVPPPTLTVSESLPPLLSASPTLSVPALPTARTVLPLARLFRFSVPRPVNSKASPSNAAEPASWVVMAFTWKRSASTALTCAI
jgi:hypothetical protein